MINTKSLLILAYPKIDHEKDYVYFWMPFSLLTVAKELVDQGQIDVMIFDGNQRSADDWMGLLRSERDRLLFIGFSIMTGGGQIGHALDLARLARVHCGNVPLVFGGPHVSVLPEQTIEHELVDIAIAGPGQNSIASLVDALQGRRDLATVPGLIAKTASGGLIRGPGNPPKTGVLGQYPWHLLDVQSYIRDDPTVATRTLNYVSSQGCAYRCRFCYEQMYNRKWSAQEADALMCDVETLVKRYQLNGMKFYDADWFINLRRVDEICLRLMTMDTPIRWAASINPNDVLRARKQSPQLLHNVARSGCSRLLMGVESGSDRVLRDIVKKDVTRDAIMSVAKEIADHGILGSYTFIVGFPGETDAEVDETYRLLDWLRTLSPVPETRVHLFAPYPGTPLFDDAVKSGFEPPRTLQAWSNYDYYDNQTPWTSKSTVERARSNTHMTKPRASGKAA
ncbi:B12-binding domain-containing radical SAM protein [Bradyrhizobium sp. HKCCYLRH1062]|uniref:B12-binding domain-containing radical SAM protein n=1 Tax=unclassified Bradyrhizobium TaxID=2631580 RepID=UPI003EC09D1D